MAGGIGATAVLVVVLLATGCGPMTQRASVDKSTVQREETYQKSLALEGLLADQARLYRVSHPMLIAAAEMCKEKVRYRVGAFAVNREMLGSMKDVAHTQGIGVQPKVVAVAAGSAADFGGMRVADLLLSVNGKTMPTGNDSRDRFKELMDEVTASGAPLAFKIRRNAVDIELEPFPPDRVCAYDVHLGPQDSVNAFADGKRVIVTRGMLRFAASDTELELVIAHEIAHNAMGHLDARFGNQLIGAIIDAIIAGATRTQSTGLFSNLGAAAFSQDFEAEADYVGLYIMARAGRKVSDAPAFWRRMASQYPGNIGQSHTTTHPASSYRFVALDQAVREIEGKRSRGEPMRPEMKKDK